VTKKKLTPQVQLFKVITRAVEEGVAYGIRRYNKYSERPIESTDEIHVAENVEREVLNALDEVIDFGDDFGD